MAKKNKVDKLSKDEARELLEDWADSMQLDTDRELFDDVVDELLFPVRLQMLKFDEGTSTFTLQLKDPVQTKNDGQVLLVDIKSCNFDSKRKLQNYKDNESIDSARAMISAYTGQPESVVKELMDLDISRINSIICGFITQVAPKKK